MPFARNRARIFVAAVALLVALTVAAVLLRLTLTAVAVNTLLRRAGATEVTFRVARASPWAVVLEDLGVQWRAQAIAAKRVSLTRAHWWTPSLGAFRVEQARVPLSLDDIAAVFPTIKNAPADGARPSLPFEEISVDGQLVVQTIGLPEQAVGVRIEARLSGKNSWDARVRAEGPELNLQATGSFNQATGEAAFKISEVSLDLKTWQAGAQRLVAIPSGPWELEGKLAGSAAGKFTAGILAAGGRFNLREGRIHGAAKNVTADGIEADLEFLDFSKLITRPASLRVRELRVGGLLLQEVDAAFVFDGNARIVVSRLSLRALGGRASAEPFEYFPPRRELEAVLLVDGISIEEIMALTKDLPAKASGRVNGRFPVTINESGVRLGTGWLALTPNVAAEIQFEASGLLTGGSSENSPSYAILKKIESGLLKLKISELRLDIRPPNAPPGRSAQLHVAGAPVDPEVIAPVTLDLNVNGPLEELINLGLDSRLEFKN